MNLTPAEQATINQQSIDAANKANAASGKIATAPAVGSAFVNPTPSSLISSSAKPVIDAQAATASKTATTAMDAPATPPISITTLNGVKITPNGSYQYQLANGSMVSVTDPTINKSLLAGATFLSGPQGTEQDPLSTSGPTLPYGYTTGTPDASGNVAYTNSQGQTVLTAPAGSDVSGTIKNLDSIQSQIGSDYKVSADPSGNVQVTDSSGKAIPIPVAAASDPNSIGQSVGSIRTYQDTKTTINTNLQAQLGELQTQLNQQITDIETQRKTALAQGGANAGSTSAVSTTTGSYMAAINDRFDKLVQQARDSYNAAVNTANASAANATNAAEQDLTNSLNTIAENAKQTNISMKQTAQTNFWNSLKSLGSIDTSTKEGASAASQLMQTGLQAGLSMEGAMGYINLGTLASKKLDQSTFMQNVKAEMIPDSIASMTGDQAKTDKGAVGYLMQQAENVGMNSDQAFSFLQGLYQNKLQPLNLQKLENQNLKIQQDISLAPLKIMNAQNSSAINSAQKMVNVNFKGTNAPLAKLASASYWMPNVEASYNQIKSGNYQALPTLLDAKNKLDTGGQAIRQGQTNLQMDAGTLMDNLKALGVKYGFSTSGASYDANGNLVWSGGTPQLSAKQIDGIYNDALAISSEIAKTSEGTYTRYKNGIDSLANQYPTAAGDIYGMTAGNETIDNFYQNYAKTTGGGQTVNVGGKDYQVGVPYFDGKATWVFDSQGNYTKK